MDDSAGGQAKGQPGAPDVILGITWIGGQSSEMAASPGPRKRILTKRKLKKRRKITKLRRNPNPIRKVDGEIAWESGQIT